MTAKEFFKEKYSDHNSMVYYPPSEYRIAEIMEEYHQAKTRWISVEERLPNDGDLVALINIHHNLSDASFFYADFDAELYTHWQTLPEPPTT